MSSITASFFRKMLVIVLIGLSYPLFADVEFSTIYKQVALERGIGAFGMEADDLNSDGLPELIFGNANGWHIYQFNETTQEYDFKHAELNLPETGGDLYYLRTYRDSEGDPLIIAARDNGRIDIYDGRTVEIIRSISSGYSEVNRIEDFIVADADNNGSLDLIVTGNGVTRILDLESGTVLLTLPYGGSAVRVGNVDEDVSLELVVSSGQVIRVSGAEYEVLWDSIIPFGDWIELGSFDDDGALEIIGVDNMSYYRGIDAADQSFVWEQEAFDTDSFQLADVTGDGVPEIILGDGQWGDVHAHDIKTRETLWTIDNPKHGVTSSLVVDSDGDGNLELIWGAGYSSSGGDYVYIYDLVDMVTDWTSTDTYGRFAAKDVGDLNGDGTPEIVYASWESDSGYGDGLMYVLDGITYEPHFISDYQYFGGDAWTGIHDLRVANVDDDSQPEILVTTGETYTGALFVIDGISFESSGPFLFDSGTTLYAMEVYDVENDGQYEVIAGGGKEHTGSPGTYVYMINPRTGEEIWHSPSITTGWEDTTDIHVADIDADGDDDIIAVAGGASLLNISTGAIEGVLSGDNYSVVTVLQVDEDNALEILIGTDNGLVQVVDGDSLVTQRTIRLCASRVSGLEPMGDDAFIASCGTDLIAYHIGLDYVLWSSEIDEGSAYSNSLRSYVSDGSSHILFGGEESFSILADASDNVAPVASPMSFTTHWRNILLGQLMASDDDETDVIRYEILSGTVLGDVELIDSATGDFSFTPAIVKGVSQFQYRAVDRLSASEPAQVTLTVTNTAPSAEAMDVDVHWRGRTSITLQATDADEDPLQYLITVQPELADVVEFNEQTGVVIVQMSENATSQEDSLLFTATDSIDSTAESEVNIRFTNDPPEVQAGTFSTNGVNSISGQVTGSDPNNDPIEYIVITQPSKGTLDLDTETGRFEYTPVKGMKGDDRFVFAVRDGLSESETGAISIVNTGNGASLADNRLSGGAMGIAAYIMLIILFSLRVKVLFVRRA